MPTPMPTHATEKPSRDPAKGKHVQHTKKNAKFLKRQREEAEIQDLERRVQEFHSKDVKNFSELPLTKETAKGLKAAHFTSLTDIQRKAIPLALKGRDILGAAKTGSGKTLAFLVPVLETLFRKKWTSLDGLGALIISPTRELAVQIFEVLRQIGRYHTFSAGLVIGGKNVREEKERLSRMNILVCTPGRMVQHMSETAGFDADNLQLLVLDEADRILDMGFRKALDAIIENLPRDRRTLLFSATQTSNVADLARLSLKDPEYVSVHESSQSATPSALKQFYVVIPLPEKLDHLYSFLRNNLTSKILVFMSSCKQVRYVYETFRKLHIGIPLLHLHGKQKQTARTEITARFSAAQKSCLFATDVVARGLDFPAVNWVIQLDCPEDAATYIHRVGRTARFDKDGAAVLFLCPSEKEMFLKRLEAKKVPIQENRVVSSRKQSIQNHLQAMCFKDPTLKYLGQKAFVSYTKSIYIQKDREVFDLDKLPLDEFAASLGLPGTPNIVRKERKNGGAEENNAVKELKNESYKIRKELALGSSDEDEEDDLEGEEEVDEGGGEKKKNKKAKEKKKEVRTKYDRMFERKNQTVLADHYNKLISTNADADADAEDNFLTVKRTGYDSDSDADGGSSGHHLTHPRVLNIPGAPPLIIDSNRRQKLLTSKKELLKYKPKGTKLVFDDDGTAHPIYELDDLEGFKKDGDAESQRRKFVEEEGRRVQEADAEDREVARDKRREKRERRKIRERVEMENADGAGSGDEEDGGDGGGVIPLVPYEEFLLISSDNSPTPSPLPEPSRKQKKHKREESDEEEGNEPNEPLNLNPYRDSKKRKKEEKQMKRNGASVLEIQDEPETLEDLERLATGLLG